MDHTKLHRSEPERSKPNQSLHQPIIMCKQKREHCMVEVKRYNLRFWDFIHPVVFKGSSNPIGPSD
jgi:hypothetical protein